MVIGARLAKILAVFLCAGAVAFAAFGWMRATSIADAPVYRPGEWPLHGGNASGSRHATDNQIDAGAIERVGLAWEFDGFQVRGSTHRGMQATPIMVDGVLYVTGPWSVVHALDARTGRPRWTYDPKVPGQWARKACCDVVNRGVAIAEGTVFVGTTDGFLDALDAASGQRRWRVDTLTDRSRAYTITGAPLIAGDMVVIGNGGGELGVRGYLSAYDRRTGRLAWRFWTVPGNQPDENADVTAARRTWSRDARFDYGLGGTVWDGMAYDHELGIVYAGTGNGSPWPGWVRSPGGGDNLYLSSILAIDVRSGRLRWHYQTTPGDSWDFTATQNLVFADLDIGDRRRKVVMQAPKNGFFYVLDRATGELLSAKPYAETSWAEKVDPVTGRPVPIPEARYQDGVALVTPGIAGAHNWQPMAFNPETRLVYIPVLHEEMAFIPWRDGWLKDTISVEARVEDPAAHRSPDQFGEAPAAPHSRLVAFDPVTGTKAWEADARAWWSGGVLSTAAGLVFQGGSDGELFVHDARTGRVLRRIATGTAIMAPPISYTLDGVQYIAVVAGLGGSVKIFPPGSAALERRNHERLLVFRLDGKAVPLPPVRVVTPPRAVPASAAPAATVAQGEALFFRHCARCHNVRGVPNNYPDLWRGIDYNEAQFRAIILGGALEPAGMPRFDDLLSARDSDAIRAFIQSDAYRQTR